MKNILTMLTVLAAAALFMFLSSASPPTLAADKPEVGNVQVLIIGSPGAGVTAALTAQLAQHGVEAIFVAESDGDGLTALSAETPIVANKHGIVPIATAARIEPLIQRKTETRESVSNLTGKKFYDLPPERVGYDGSSIANPTRASPRI